MLLCLSIVCMQRAQYGWSGVLLINGVLFDGAS